MNTDETTRKNVAMILRGVANTGLKPVARAVGVDESTISRYKDRDFERHARILAVCGLKVVPAAAKCFKPDDVDVLFHLAKQRINSMSGHEDLAFLDEDPE